MNYKLSDRVHKVKPSFTLQMATIAAEMRAEGLDVINFSVGEPDFNTPEHIISAGKLAMDQGYTKYTAGPGMIEFRQAICEKLKRENGITYDKEDILVSNGEKQKVVIARALINNPKIIIADQPENNLDNNTIRKVFFLFESLNKQGTTIIITSNLKNIIKLDYKTINLNNLSNDKL